MCHDMMIKVLILAAVLTTLMIAAGSNQVFLKSSLAAVQQQGSGNSTSNTTMNIRPNIQTDFNPNVTWPKISKTAYVDPFAVVIGDCQIGKLVLIAPFAVCRGDEGTPIYIGDYSNLQDGVILHSLKLQLMARILMTEDIQHKDRY
jgi:UDP-3-O-[3-hydroxymyristoyl] glucosamine N-acyltransferase